MVSTELLNKDAVKETIEVTAGPIDQFNIQMIENYR